MALPERRQHGGSKLEKVLSGLGALIPMVDTGTWIYFFWLNMLLLFIATSTPYTHDPWGIPLL